MISAELLTRSSIWISIAAYVIGTVLLATTQSVRWVRLAWTIGCAALLAHFVFAFHFYHSWSHESAYLDTARQTAEVFAVNWGGGLFINYAVATLWTADVAWWWAAGIRSYLQRPWWLTLLWHGFLIFIIFNATVVFKDGWPRWVGLVLSLTLCLSWIVISRQRNELSKH